MKRGGPLKRRTPLRTLAPLRRLAELRRSSAPSMAAAGGKVPEGGVPRRRSRGHSLPADVRLLVRGRSGGVCEIRLAGCTGRASEVHHRLARKAGGRHGAARGLSDRASNLLDCCWFCHHVVTESPGAARLEGWSLLEWQDPLTEPVLYRGEPSYLDDEGGVHSAEKVGA